MKRDTFEFLCQVTDEPHGPGCHWGDSQLDDGTSVIVYNGIAYTAPGGLPTVVEEFCLGGAFEGMRKP